MHVTVAKAFRALWLVLIVGLSFGQAVGEGAQVVPERHAAITVNGTGVVWAEPDQAVVELGWSGVDADVGAAVAEGNEVIAAIRDAAVALGVDPLDVRTTGFHVWREERYDDRDGPRLVGFRVSHMLQVVLRDVELVGELIAAATEAGANQVGGIAFTVADRHALEQEARVLAFASARQRAEQLAALAGANLGSAIEIEELSLGAPGIMEPMLDMGGRGGAPIAAGRHAVEIVVRVSFSMSE
jgi:uncharacterized protein